jgi:hypothetical protein
MSQVNTEEESHMWRRELAWRRVRHALASTAARLMLALQMQRSQVGEPGQRAQATAGRLRSGEVKLLEIGRAHV